MSIGEYGKLSVERKKMQAEGVMPEWFSTGGWQLFKDRYLYQADNPKQQYERIAATLSKHTPDPEEFKTIFFDLLWKGWLSPSTPVLSNTGTERGLPVSCAGNYTSDNIYDIFDSRKEVALLTKHGFGTASYLGDLRGRGDTISVGGKAAGLMPVIDLQSSDMEYVSQGGVRRGSWAGYLDISHKDFFEVDNKLATKPDGLNIGYVWYDSDTLKMKTGDEDMTKRWQSFLKTKMITGKGYLWFADKANRKAPQMYKDKGLKVRTSQLCNEISLMCDKDHTFTCVLSSMNLAKWDEWKDTDAVYYATIFLDAVCQEFLNKAKNIKGLEKAIAFTKKSRALGLGVAGYHTYLIDSGIPFNSFQAQHFNRTMSKKLKDDSLRASQWLAGVWGEPEWCKGYGVANTHRLAIAPTKSTALIMGGVSEGINPVVAYVFTQRSAGGEISRVDPSLLKVMKAKGVYNKKNIEEIADAMGSVQGVSWLSEEEKEVFKTAFEIDQYAILKQAEDRGKNLCQWQSLNLFFSAKEDEGHISKVHQYAVESEDILGLYYVYSMADVQASNDKDECVACQ
jgi:ribonucleoside-diphosphate reductase alpha chain